MVKRNAFNNVINSQNVFHFCTMSNLATKNKTMKNSGKPWNGQPWTLVCILIFQIMSSFFRFIFLSKPIELPSKMVPLRGPPQMALNSLGSSSKSLESNLWLLTNTIAPFCWTFLPLGPSSKVHLMWWTFVKMCTKWKLHCSVAKKSWKFVYLY